VNESFLKQHFQASASIGAVLNGPNPAGRSAPDGPGSVG
jgi:hypothetical protein